MNIKIQHILFFLLFVLTSFLLCVSFFDFRGPRVDESELIFPAVEFFSGCYDPYWYGYGSFGMYILHVFYVIIGFLGLIVGSYDSWNDYLIDIFEGDIFYRLARYIFTIISMVTCLVYARILKLNKLHIVWIIVFLIYQLSSKDCVYFANYLRSDQLLSLAFAGILLSISVNLKWQKRAILFGIFSAISLTSKTSGIVILSLPVLYYFNLYISKLSVRIPFLKKKDYTPKVQNADSDTNAVKASVVSSFLKSELSKAFFLFLISFLLFTFIFQPYQFPVSTLLDAYENRVSVSADESLNFQMAHDYLPSIHESFDSIIRAFKTYFSKWELILFLFFPLLFFYRYKPIYLYVLIAFLSLTTPYLIAKQISPYWFIPAFVLMRFMIILILFQFTVLIHQYSSKFIKRNIVIFHAILAAVFSFTIISQNVEWYLEFRKDLSKNKTSNVAEAKNWIEDRLLGKAIVYRDGYIMHKMPIIFDENVQKSKGLSRAFNSKFGRDHYKLLHSLFEKHHENYINSFASKNINKRKIKVDDLRMIYNESNLNGNYFVATPSNHNRYLQPTKELNTRQKSIALNYQKIFEGSKLIKSFKSGSGHPIQIYKMTDVPEFEPENAIEKIKYIGRDTLLDDGILIDVVDKDSRKEYEIRLYFQNNQLQEEKYSLNDDFPRMPFIFGNWTAYKTGEYQLAIHCKKCNNKKDIIKNIIVPKDRWIELKINYSGKENQTIVKANDKLIMTVNGYVPISKKILLNKGYLNRLWLGPIGEIWINDTEILFEN